jgi:hypothetical protein
LKFISVSKTKFKNQVEDDRRKHLHDVQVSYYLDDYLRCWIRWEFGVCGHLQEESNAKCIQHVQRFYGRYRDDVVLVFDNIPVGEHLFSHVCLGPSDVSNSFCICLSA